MVLAKCVFAGLAQTARVAHFSQLFNLTSQHPKRAARPHRVVQGRVGQPVAFNRLWLEARRSRSRERGKILLFLVSDRDGRNVSHVPTTTLADKQMLATKAS